MAYLFPNHEIGFGERSKSYVIREGETVRNISKGKSIHYDDLIYWIKKYKPDTVRRRVGEGLTLSVLELDVVFPKVLYDIEAGLFGEREEKPKVNFGSRFRKSK